MANLKQMETLKQGVKVWNQWREDNPNVEPDLSGVDLRGMELSGINFNHVDLTGSNLSHVDLSNSNLRAILIGAILAHANLSDANLTGADLGEATLTGASLNDADFSGAWFGSTTFGNNDLSKVKGLEISFHYAPSVFGLHTFYRSLNNIPERFLLLAGVPEGFINYIRSLIARPLLFYSCFISYSSKDQDFADSLHAGLRKKGVRCWFAPEDLKIGDKFRNKIDETIRSYDKLLLVLSENSVSSQWVADEVEAALERERNEDRIVLFPIKIDDTVMESKTGWAAAIRRSRHIGNFTNWKRHNSYKDAFDRLIRDLQAEADDAIESRA